MSRSRKKTKVFGITTADSEKQAKRRANRRFRRICKLYLQDIMDDDEDSAFPELEEVSNVWSMDKDGKRYWSDATDKDMRK
tara:strand:- start:4788 stop:5030 length:243 start_codon:yes stop_codon:yes gene_type:complete